MPSSRWPSRRRHPPLASFGNPLGVNGVLELERPAGAGIPLDRLLASATIEAARAFHLEQRYGRIEPGKVANLLLLRATRWRRSPRTRGSTR